MKTFKKNIAPHQNFSGSYTKSVLINLGSKHSLVMKLSQFM